MHRHALSSIAAAVLIVNACCAGDALAYKAELDIVYCKVEGRELKLHAFIPENATKAPAMVDIHGGWWSGGMPARSIDSGYYTPLRNKGIAIFTISYRLGKEGGFPQNIRDCRNAIRFIRKNAERFKIDPERIGCMGGSAGSHLSMMCAMVPEDFDDGGPTDDLKGVSAKVCNAYSFVGPTDFVAQWNEAVDGAPNDAKRYHRVLFKGVEPDTDERKALYTKMSPIGHVRKDIAPLLICDGEKDPVVPHLHGKTLHEKLKAVGADTTYWMTPGGGHSLPAGDGFAKVLDDFLIRTLKIEKK